MDSAWQKLAAEAPAAEAVLLYGDMPQELTTTARAVPASVLFTMKAPGHKAFTALVLAPL